MDKTAVRFPARLEIAFVDDGRRQNLIYEKVTWTVGAERAGLRHGDNPSQPAALYRLLNGNLTLGEVTDLTPGEPLASLPEILQSPDHPIRIMITDTDAALNILRHLTDEPACVIVNHNNPCGVARANSLTTAYLKATLADRVAAIGACAAFNRPIDSATAQALLEGELAVVIAPEFEEGTLALLAKKPGLRVLRVGNMARLAQCCARPFVDFKSLIDGGLIVQLSPAAEPITRADCLPAAAAHKGREIRIRRQPLASEWNDLLFGWKIVRAVTSISVIFVKDGVTVGIGAGQQDRISAAQNARDKAYRKLVDRLAWERSHSSFNRIENADLRQSIRDDARELRGGLIGAAMASDGPIVFADPVEMSISEGVTAIIQPGGSTFDHEAIRLCNENNVAMVFTGQRVYKY